MMLPILDVDSAADNLDKLDKLSQMSSGGWGHAEGLLGALIGLAAVLLIFGSPVMIVMAVLRHRTSKQRVMADLALRLAEKGQTVPPDLFSDAMPVRSDLRRGIIWASVGLGVAVFGAFDGDNDVIGIGYAVAAWLENRQRRML